MKTILIAIGNTLRGDDGAAHRVLELLGDLPGVGTLAVHQLTPENAAEIASADQVFFVDADIRPGEPAIEELGTELPAHSPFGHTMTPAEIAALSRTLFNFQGKAFLVRVPCQDFSQREALSREAEKNAKEAAAILRRKLSGIPA